METKQTTAHALNTRAQNYVDQHPNDPVALANHLINEAIRLQDAGRFAEADQLLDRADTLTA
jgi:hypothetical protein